MNKIEWKRKAIKQMASMPEKARDQIKQGVHSLQNWPQVANVKSLTNRDDYRLRVGRYRILFTVWPNAK